MGTFLNPDTTRIVAKRVVLTGHPFKVHKKTATVRFMFFNSGSPTTSIFFFFSATSNMLSSRWCTLFQAHPTPYKTRPNGPYTRIPRDAWIFQGSFRRPHQSNGHCLYVFVQTRFPQMGTALDWTWSIGDPGPPVRCNGRINLFDASCSRKFYLRALIFAKYATTEHKHISILKIQLHCCRLHIKGPNWPRSYES